VFCGEAAGVGGVLQEEMNRIMNRTTMHGKSFMTFLLVNKGTKP
jgi:hypothetical protein